MSETTWLLIIGVVLVVMYLRHQWHVRRYPERAHCRRCEGAGKITSTDLWGRAVRGDCPHCGGQAWVARRRSERR